MTIDIGISCRYDHGIGLRLKILVLEKLSRARMDHCNGKDDNGASQLVRKR